MIKKLYSHYKGELYIVIDIAEHTETGEEFIVYRKLEGEKVWCRAAKMFFEFIDYKGGRIQRFTEFAEFDIPDTFVGL